MSNLVIANETITALDNAAKAGLIAQKEASQFKKMALVAGAIQELRALLTPKVMAPVMALQGTAIGFRTDKDGKGGYDVDTVKDCLIEATLQGVFPVGNEFNIIASRCYITKEGFGHKLRDIPGLSYMITPSVPVMRNGGAVVKMLVEWTYNGKSNSRELEIAVRVNNGMGTDAIIGKAERKARAWLYKAVTGQEIGEGDVEDLDAIDVTVTDVEATSPFEEEATTEPPPEEAQDELPM
jgi:hypothetical protein